MAEITGISCMEIVDAAIIPAVMYFALVYFMVDLAAKKVTMKGLPRDARPKLVKLIKWIDGFLPIMVLIHACFSGYWVICCGTFAMMHRAPVHLLALCAFLRAGT